MAGADAKDEIEHDAGPDQREHRAACRRMAHEEKADPHLQRNDQHDFHLGAFGHTPNNQEHLQNIQKKYTYVTIQIQQVKRQRKKEFDF